MSKRQRVSASRRAKRAASNIGAVVTTDVATGRLGNSATVYGSSACGESRTVRASVAKTQQPNPDRAIVTGRPHRRYTGQAALVEARDRQTDLRARKRAQIAAQRADLLARAAELRALTQSRASVTERLTP